MATHHIPKKQFVFAQRSEVDKELRSEESFILVERMRQYDALNSASNSPDLIASSAHSIARSFSESVGKSTKAEAYNEVMGRLSGGIENDYRFLFPFGSGVRTYATPEESQRLDDVLSGIEKYGSNGVSAKNLLPHAKDAQQALGLPDPVESAEKAFAEIEADPGKFEAVDKEKYIEAAMLGVSYDDYISGAAQERYRQASEKLIPDVTDKIAARAHKIMESDYGLRDYDVSKAYAMENDPSWELKFQNEIEGERFAGKTQQDQFKEWKDELRKESPDRVRLIDDTQLFYEFHTSKINPDEEAYNEYKRRNDEALKEAKFNEMVLDERRSHLTDEEKVAEFNAQGAEYEEMYKRNTEKVRQIIIEREAQKNAEAEKQSEAPEVEQAEPNVSDGVEGSPKPLHGSDINLKAEASGEELEAEIHASNSPQPLHGSNINLKNESSEVSPEAKAPISTEEFKLEDLTPEQKAANKVLGIHGNNMLQDISALREVQQRSMLLDHLQNTPEGQQEFDAYVAARAGRLQESGGAKGGKLYDKTMSYMLQMDSKEMEEEFPGAAKAIHDERQGIDIEEEYEFFKSNIDSSIEDSPEKSEEIKDELRREKQVDVRLGAGDRPNLMGRLQQSADSGIDFKKYGMKALACFGAGMAIAGGPVGIAAFIGAKMATHYATKSLVLQEKIDPNVTKALVESGMTDKEAIKKQKEELLKKHGRTKWGEFLRTAAAVGVGVTIGLAIGDVDISSIKSNMSDLVSQGAELFNDAELPGADNSIAGGVGDFSQDLEGLTANTPDPDTVINEQGPEASQAVADGAQVDAVTHVVEPGETMGGIVNDYLIGRGIDTSSLDLWGPDGVVSQTGMNIDDIKEGQIVDLSEVERYAQAMESGENFVPSEDAVALNTSTPMPDPSAPEAPGPTESARANFLNQVEATKSVEQSGPDIAKSNFMDNLETRNGPEGGMYANVDGQANIAQADAKGPGIEGGFTSEMPNEPRITEAEALENLKEKLTAQALERAGPEGGAIKVEIGEVMTPEEALASQQAASPSPETDAIEQLMDEAVESVPDAVAPSSASPMTMAEVQSQIEDTIRDGGYAHLTVSDAGYSVQQTDGLPNGMERSDLHSAEDLYDNDDNGPSGP